MVEVASPKRFPSPKPLSQLLPRVKAHAPKLAGAMVCLLLSVAIAPAFPQIVRRLLDAAFVASDGSLLNQIALSLLGLFAIQAVLNYLQVYLLTMTFERNHRRAAARSFRAPGASLARILHRAENR